MSQKRIRTRTCPKCGKGIYLEEVEIIRVILKRTKRGAPPLRYYECPHTPGVLHITSKIITCTPKKK